MAVVAVDPRENGGRLVKETSAPRQTQRAQAGSTVTQSTTQVDHLYTHTPKHTQTAHNTHGTHTTVMAHTLVGHAQQPGSLLVCNNKNMQVLVCPLGTVSPRNFPHPTSKVRDCSPKSKCSHPRPLALLSYNPGTLRWLVPCGQVRPGYRGQSSSQRM